MQQSPHQNPDNDGRKFMMFGAIILSAITTTGHVFLHRGFGARFFGLQALAPLLIIPAFGLFFPGHDQTALLTFLAVYLVTVFGLRIESIFRRPKECVHSRYDGTPYLSQVPLFRRLSELTIKRFIEPCMLGLIATWVLSWDQPLGFYLLMAAFVCLATANSAEAYERMRAREATDALIEQQQVGERIRSTFFRRF